MRRITKYFLMASALIALGLVTGCNNSSVPPADGYYTNQFTNTSTGVNTTSGYTLIDGSGHAVIVNPATSTITRFLISSIDDNGNFTANTTTFTGTTVSSDISANTAPIAGTIAGTLHGSGGGVGGGSVSRDTITGSITTGSTVIDFTFTYNSGVYENDATAFSTVATSANNAANGAIYNYGTGSSLVQLQFTSLVPTASNGINSYPVNVTLGSCVYSGSISQPNSENAYELSDLTLSSGSSCPTSSTLSGLAYYNPSTGSPANLAIEVDDSTSVAVAGYASLTN